MRIAVAALLTALVIESAFACGGGSGHGHGGPGGGQAERGASRPGTAGGVHGGDVFLRSEVLYELVETSGELIIYAYDGDRRPVDLEGTTGSIIPTSDEGCAPELVELASAAGSDSGARVLVAALPTGVRDGACNEFRISLLRPGSTRQSEVSILWARPEAPRAGRKESGHKH